MAHEELQRASEELQVAAEAADGEERERLEGQAEAFAKLAEQGADHGLLGKGANDFNGLVLEGDGLEHRDEIAGLGSQHAEFV